ncbi:polysaccharide biosynthesis tyrosine autokinase [Cupriavidus pauculus]|uniref:Tyrosine protein kinase n=1 Tax=Cupriavidus pauculus TaxID=82633 RepID=A0A2N5C4C6_9BURK|nr:polysaccharide biosynthesis tyrosine autokinase [Cupriavidus pauculus]PLP97065.1 tyrosine protein kinase [Cupriavidus pauculus]
MNTDKSSHANAADTWDGPDTSIDFSAYLDVLVRFRWTFILVSAAVILTGVTYALLSKPVYRSDTLVQIEETNQSSNAATKIAAAISPVFDVKPAATAEIELLRSRMVVGKAVDNLRLDIIATPRYFPVVGAAIAGYRGELSTPGLFGWGGFAWGGESIKVDDLQVPAKLDGRKIILTALGDRRFRLTFASDGATGTGTVGTPLTVNTASGPVHIHVTELDGHPGTQYVVTHVPRSAAITDLQEKLIIGERGKQSGVIGIALEDTSAERAAAILNEIGTEYVDQNTRRKAAEAEKSLAFLDKQLPQLKKQVEDSETRYNTMRNQRGTVDLSEESKLYLSQSVQIQTRLQELRQKRQELATRYTPNHPSVEILDSQIAGLTNQLAGVTGKIQRLPEVEQNVLRLMRDVKVSTEMYQALLNDAQQLRLVRASKVGTARLVDPADVPLKPVRPNRMMIAVVSLVMGMLAGAMAVVLRRMMNGGLAEAEDVERHTGMTVYATIPFSTVKAADGVLAMRHPDDPAIEAMRGFRTALQFALANSRSHVVVISGPAPGVGKSFLSANFAAIAATAGRKVLLIDADLRRGGLNRVFERPRSPGMTELLTGTPMHEAIQRDVLPGLDFIATGAQAPQAADLLQAPAMDALLESIQSRYDLVLIDTPPVLAAADAGVLAAKAGAVFLVARADSTTAGELQASLRTIAQAGGEVKGVLFNGLDVEGRWYRPHYRYGKYRYLTQYGTGNANTKAKRA